MRYLRMDVEKSLRVLGSMMMEIDTWKHLNLVYFDKQLEDELKQVLVSDRFVYQETLKQNEKKRKNNKSSPVHKESDDLLPVARYDSDPPASILIDTSVLKSKSLERLLSDISNLSS